LVTAAERKRDCIRANGQDGLSRSTPLAASPSPLPPELADELRRARLGVLGGSGLYDIAGLEDVREQEVDTPFGRPSDSFRIGRLEGMEVVFLARHGRHHHLLPGEVPYRANIWALRHLGVRWILSCSAVGSLRERVRPRDVLVPDQFIDRTRQRPATFFGGGAVAHVGLADPFCPVLSGLLADSAEACLPEGRHIHRGGTYLCMEGPAFSTRAESTLYRQWGCDVIGMTNHTEARLAREAEMAYASLALVTDYDCWHETHGDVSVEMVVDNLRANAAVATATVAASAGRLARVRPPSVAHQALREGLMSSPDRVPEATRRRLALFTERYWGPCS
jgi:5'-methylthioadenosine phosphorylase